MTEIVRIQGVDVHVEGSGGETIVMIHGWPDTYRLWDAQVTFLKDRYRCVRFTVPGFDPAGPRRAYGLDELTDFVREVVDRLASGGQAVLMLHDWGCVIGYAFYARFPDRVTRIIGVDIGDSRSLRKVLTAREQALILGYQLWLALAWKAPRAIGDRMTRFMARRARCPSEPGQISSNMTYPYYELWLGNRSSWRSKVPAFRPSVPTLFIYAKRKPFMFHSRTWAEALAQKPGNRVEGFDTGHWVMSQEPERFNQVVGEWLAKG